MDTLFEALTTKFSETRRVDIKEHFQEFKDLADYVNVQFSRKDPSPSYDEFQKEVLKQSWEYFEKKYVSKIDSTRALDFVDSYDTHIQSQTQSLKGLYQHTGYGQERQEMQSLVLDSDDDANWVTSATAQNTFSFELAEPLIIDKYSHVYLDNFITLGVKIPTATGNESAFLITIDQFKINAKGSGKIDGSSIKNFKNYTIIIPNSAAAETTTTSVIQKGTKKNYIAQINPQKIRKITGSITGIGAGGDASTTTIFKVASGRFILQFLIVAREKMAWK